MSLLLRLELVGSMTAQTSLGKFCIIVNYKYVYFIDLKCSCTVKMYIRTEACVIHCIQSMSDFKCLFCTF